MSLRTLIQTLFSVVFGLMSLKQRKQELNHKIYLTLICMLVIVQ